MTAYELEDFVLKSIKEHPGIADEIRMQYQLCLDEIEAGESPWNERELCYEEIKQLTEEQE